MNTPPVSVPGRQVHLDFHTSPYINDLLSEFDAEEMADTFAEAHVNSVTVFAKCHHGMSYHSTNVGHSHPHLNGRDLLGEQIEALHRRSIRAPIYFTIGWEERLALLQPEWRQLKKDGTFANQEQASDHSTKQPGAWKFMCFNHPEYLEYIEAHLEEIISYNPVDGLFLDIVYFHPEAGFSDHNRVLRRKHGLLEATPAHFHRFQQLVRLAFIERITGLIHDRHPKATVFYNTDHKFSSEATYDIRSMNQFQTHWEIESLPSGFWGYLHFPRFARHTETFNRPWIGMTGRFQRMWGDFGGIKPKAALEFECYRSQAYGGGNSIGDQLPPRGRLEPTVYDMIGSVYAQVEAAEPFYQGSRLVSEVGVFLASHPEILEQDATMAEEGAVMMLEEAHYNPLVLDDNTDLDSFAVLILPDSTVVTEKLSRKLRAFYAQGGQLIISYRAGCDTDGRWCLDFLPLAFHGEEEMSPTYWRMVPAFWKDADPCDRVFYESGMLVDGGHGTEVLVERVLPYFKRSDVRFMSHFQAPPVKEADTFPAVVGGAGFVYFADPVCAGYRRHGSCYHRDVFEHVMLHLIGSPFAGEGLPRTVRSLPRRRGQDLIITLLHYIPTRKSVETDIVEEPLSFAGEILRIRALPDGIIARQFRGQELQKSGPNSFILPPVKGRLLIELPGYFDRR